MSLRGTLSVTFLIADKTPGQKNLKKEGPAPHGLRAQPSHSNKNVKQLLTFTSIVREQREMNAYAQLAPFLYSV